MLFSIIVPVYNVEKYLSECLESLVMQVRKCENGCEIILVDDGSTDNSSAICDDYQRKYSDIIYVYHRENHGLLQTRRFGYQQAKGEYIINCDSDDLLENNFLYIQEKVIEDFKHPDMIIFNYYMYYQNKRIECNKNLLSDYDVSSISKERVLKEFLRGYKLNSLCGAIYNRKCIDINNTYEDLNHFNNGEDSLQKVEFFNNSNSYVYINKPLYYYRMSSGMTGHFDPNYLNNFDKVFYIISKSINNWNIENGMTYFSIKILSTSGRAITQSRYNKWKSYSEKIEYLKSIRNDKFVNQSLPYLNLAKSSLQKDHYVLLKLLKDNKYKAIERLLTAKNLISRN